VTTPTRGHVVSSRPGPGSLASVTRSASFANARAVLGSSTTGPRSEGPRSRPVRPTLALGAALAGLALVTGCTTMSPSQTLVPYQPADGVALDVGSVQGRDLLLVASAKGATGVLSGSLINTGTTTVTVTFAAASAPGTASGTPPKATTLRLAPSEQTPITKVEIPELAAAPGDLTQIAMTTSDGTGIASVPVLLPTDYYATVTPSPTTTSAETTPAPTGTTRSTTATASATTTAG